MGNAAATQNWYVHYVLHPDTGNRHFERKFRRRFRMPYQEFLNLVEDVKECGHFRRWTSRDAVGRESSPIELMILGALRYMGRGWTFDDLEEATAIDEETHRQFFHSFLNYGSTVLFARHVTAPATAVEGADHEHEMRMAGFYGAVGSMDATHVKMEMCYSGISKIHQGPKMPYTARTYNMTVNHRRRILSTTHGHPAIWNDKTIVLFDEFARGIKNGDILKDFEFSLLQELMDR